MTDNSERPINFRREDDTIIITFDKVPHNFKFNDRSSATLAEVILEFVTNKQSGESVS